MMSISGVQCTSDSARTASLLPDTPFLLSLFPPLRRSQTHPQIRGTIRDEARLRLRARDQSFSGIEESRCIRWKIYRAIALTIALVRTMVVVVVVVVSSSFIFLFRANVAACDHVNRRRTYVPAKIYRGAMGVTCKTRRQSITTGGMHDDHVISNFCLARARARIARSIWLAYGRIRADFFTGCARRSACMPIR